MNRRVVAFIVLSLGVMVLSPVVSTAQQGPEEIARLLAVTQNRPAVESAIHQKWSVLAEDGGDELASALARLPVDKLLRVQAARTIEEVDAVVYGTQPGVEPPNAIGSNSVDLVFTPVAPCRIINTIVTGTPLVAGVTRLFDANGPFGPQGGSATNCGLPGDDPAALAVTITVVAPQGPGNLRAWPAYTDVPTASVINYAAVPGLNLANTTVVPLTQATIFANEFAIRADVSGTHLIADVVGYYWAPAATALEQTILYTGHSAGADSAYSFDSPSCPLGWTLTGGGCNSQYGDAWLCGSRPNTWLGPASWWTCQGYNPLPAPIDIVAVAVCSRVPGR